MTEAATREIFWQITHRWPFYLASIVSALIFVTGLWTKARSILNGAPSQGEMNCSAGLYRTLKDLLSHRTIRKEPLAGIIHILIFYPFMLLFFVTLYVMISEYFAPEIFSGLPYLALNLFADLAGISVSAGVALALIRRCMIRKDRQAMYLESTVEDIGILALIGFLALSGLLLEGLRIHLQGDPWKAFSPGGWVASALFAQMGEARGVALFHFLWWIHALAALGFIAWLPFCKLSHSILTPVNLILASDVPPGTLSRTDLRGIRAGTIPLQDMRMGIFTSRDVTRKQRLELVSCMRCGRCQGLCPAVLCGQPLSPKKFIQDVKGSVEKEGTASLRRDDSLTKLPAGAVSPEALWACRLCRACEEHCPAGIRHMVQVMGIRRAEVLGHGRVPIEAAQALRSLARTGNPYGASSSERERWIQEHQISTSPATGNDTLLLWTGCFNQEDTLKARVLSALAILLKTLTIPFMVLDGHETCCGEPSRNLGDEDLFQSLARRQIQRIEAAGVQKVLVHCPHCYTMLKDEYPSLGASFQVIHTSRFLLDCIAQGRLNLHPSPVGNKVTFHDPCFLGRYQGLYDAPRKIIQNIPGIELVELRRSREQSLCCGAGGGHYFMDLDTGERPASRRIQDVLDLNVTTLCVSCTFCMYMFEDALRLINGREHVEIADWLELLLTATHPTER